MDNPPKQCSAAASSSPSWPRLRPSPPPPSPSLAPVSLPSAARMQHAAAAAAQSTNLGLPPKEKPQQTNQDPGGRLAPAPRIFQERLIRLQVVVDGGAVRLDSCYRVVARDNVVRKTLRGSSFAEEEVASPESRSWVLSVRPHAPPSPCPHPKFVAGAAAVSRGPQMQRFNGGGTKWDTEVHFPFLLLRPPTGPSWRAWAPRTCTARTI